MFAVAVVLEWHLIRDPADRYVRLRATQLFQCCGCDIATASQSGCRGEHPVATDKIAALTNGFARETHRFVVVASAELCVGSDAVEKRAERIAWAQPQRATRGKVRFLPAPAVGQSQSVVGLRKREVGIES